MSKLLQQLHVVSLQLKHSCLSFIKQVKDMIVHKSFDIDHSFLIEWRLTIKVVICCVTLLLPDDVHGQLLNGLQVHQGLLVFIFQAHSSWCSKRISLLDALDEVTLHLNKLAKLLLLKIQCLDFDRERSLSLQSFFQIFLSIVFHTFCSTYDRLHRFQLLLLLWNCLL